MENERALADEAVVEDRKLAEALFAAGLLEDPTNNDGLIFPLPTDADIQEIVAGYDTRSTGRKVRCAVCPQHQKHFRGFRVALATGDHARIGIDCGEKQFGKDVWKAISADFTRRVEIVLLEARVQPTLNAIDNLIPLVDEWHRRTNELAKWLARFRKDVPQLAARVTSIAKAREGRLVIERQVWREGVNRNGKRFKHKDVDVQSLGRIPFPGTFLGDTPTRGLTGATRELTEAVRIFNGKVSGLALANAFRSVQRARTFLIEADRTHRGALTNLDAAWLPNLCLWASQDDALNASYEFKDGSIIHDEHGREEGFPWLTPSEFGQARMDEILALWPSGSATPSGETTTEG